jgi:hypothetical protein
MLPKRQSSSTAGGYCFLFISTTPRLIVPLPYHEPCCSSYYLSDRAPTPTSHDVGWIQSRVRAINLRS